MFSPMVAIRLVSSPCTSRPEPGNGVAAILAMSPAPSSAILVTVPTNFWNCSLRPTKSVSALTSTTAPLVPSALTPTKPSAATRPAFLAAADRPFVRSQSTAFSRSPWTSFNAFLQSIMPAPVFSRSSLTREAVISAIGSSIRCNKGRSCDRPRYWSAKGAGYSAGDASALGASPSDDGTSSAGGSVSSPTSPPEAAISARIPSSTAPDISSQ